MPNVDVYLDELEARIGAENAEEHRFDEICFDFGLELDDVTSEFMRVSKEKGEAEAIELGASKRIIYVLDVPANRYDLLGLEGFCNGVNVFLGRQQPVQYTLTEQRHVMRVNSSTKGLRDYVVCAILRDFNMTPEIYKRFIALQDKLHFNICRKRSLASVGTHDLDKCDPSQLVFEARPGADIVFTALKETEEMTATQLFKEYNDRGKAKCSVQEYLHLIEKKPAYPVIYDGSGQVLSLPPIINSEYSKIGVDTRNIFIEVTATDLTKANIVLNTLIAGFSEYCDNKYSVEPVLVEYDDGMSYITPCLDAVVFQTSKTYINANLGTTFSAEEISSLLNKMSLRTEIGQNNDDLTVCCPITRSDILHPVDIVEDVAIAFNYNNLTRRPPSAWTVGSEQLINKVSDRIRENVAMCGFTEVLTWALGPKEENYDYMQLEDKGQAVELTGSKTAMFEMVRTNILPGVLKTLSHNQGKGLSLPISLFEVGDVCHLCPQRDVGAANERRICALHCTNKEGGFEHIHGLLHRLMVLNGIEFEHAENRTGKPTYALGESNCPSFLPGMQARVLIEKDGQTVPVGQFGIVHPKVTKAFGVKLLAMCYALELNLEIFL